MSSWLEAMMAVWAHPGEETEREQQTAAEKMRSKREQIKKMEWDEWLRTTGIAKPPKGDTSDESAR